MKKLVVLKLDGDLEHGVRATLEIGEEGERPSTEITAQLPRNPELVKAIDQWQSTYRSCGKSSRLEAKKIVYGGSITQWREDCDKSAVDLRSHLNNWLLCESFRPIREKWLQQLSPSDQVRVLIRTSSVLLRKLPWHLWDLIEDYTKAEVAYCVPESEQPTSSKTPSYRDQVRILAILGNSTGINVQKDRELLENLPDATTTFLVEPQRRDINDSLWNQPWDILFFAGHSKTEGDTGRIFINQTDSLTIAQLKYALKNAVAGGLQLAIFNSCDGLGLATELEQLHIGQMIVMREPVPDQVAQKFLTDFIAAFAGSKSFYLAEREAREKLHGLEDKFPCASWLPAIFQNPAAVPPFWQDLGRRPTEICPYRGLFAFREEDAPFFKGRSAFTQMLVEAVQQQSLVAVIGPSGSGKSSVVFAGLIPQLRSEQKWRIVTFRPGDRPFRNLAAKLVPLLETGGSETDQLLEINKQTIALRQGDLALRDVVTRILEKNFGERLLLVVDQFEELYALCRDARERLLFLDSLLEAVNYTPNFTLVLTLRADFLGQALSYRPFGDALQYADLKLSPMNREELLAAVEQPATMLGVTIESGLTERIIDAVSAEPGDLPLLEFALTTLWAKQRDAQLTHAAYEEIGGVEAALSRYAEEAYGRLNEEEKERARRIFIQLVRPGEGTEDTRLKAGLVLKWSTWEVEADTRTRVLATLQQVVYGLRELRTLKGYSGGNISFSPDGKTIASASEDKTIKLWSIEGRELHTFKGHSSKVTSVSFSPDGKTIASASEDKTVKLWSIEGTQLRTLKGHSGAVTSVSFSPNGKTIASTSLDGSVKLWSIEGTQLHSLKEQNGGATGVCFSPDGKTITFVSSDGTIKRWSIESREFLFLPLFLPFGQEGQGNWLISFRPNCKTIAFSEDKTVKLWSEDGSFFNETDITIPIWRGDNVEGSVTFARVEVPTLSGIRMPSGDYITIKTYSTKLDLKGHNGAVTSVSFSPDGKIIASASEDKTVKLWSMSIEGKQLHTLKGHSGSVTSVSFSPDGKTIASASSDGTIILWNFDLEDLLVRGCDWLRDQKIKTNVSESGKSLCKHIGTQK
jgi:WD40 repeat protein